MVFPKKTLSDVPLDGQRVLLRVDYNVPMQQGKVVDGYRISQSLATIQALRQRGCQVVICSHLGRPEGKIDTSLTLAPVAAYLGGLLKCDVTFVPECIGDQVVQAAKRLGDGGVLMLENLRFHPEEAADDVSFAQRLVKDSGASYFVQDGFGVMHRKHASTDVITQFLPSVAGLLLQQEYNLTLAAMENPKRPMVVILGGDKISDKIHAVERFVDSADGIIVGGAMANTFMKYKGANIGKSKYEADQEKVLEQLYTRALDKVYGQRSVDEFIILPVDVAVTTDIASSQPYATIVGLSSVTPDEYIVDIGPQTAGRAAEALVGAGTIIWNGTMGIAEIEAFSKGSMYIADMLAKLPQATTIVGGGETADFVLHWDPKRGGSFTHVSTGGGASLTLMAGEKLPGVEALMDR